MNFVIPKNTPFYLFSTFSTFVLSVKLNCLLIVALLFIHGVRNFSMNQFLRFSCGKLLMGFFQSNFFRHLGRKLLYFNISLRASILNADGVCTHDLQSSFPACHA